MSVRDIVARACRPPIVSNYILYRSCLRKDFLFACAYCNSHETEVGRGRSYGGFEIDHFKPKSKFKALRCSYRNLMWACPDCNRVKRETWPTPAEEERGYRFVDPSRENMSDHLELLGVELIPKSSAGAYTRDEVGLNSPVHLYRRQNRIIARKRFAQIEALISNAKAAGAPVQPELEQEILELRKVLLPQVVWDAPDACLCDKPAKSRRAR
jgi:hypothetical protein